MSRTNEELNTEWKEFKSSCGFQAHWRREASTLHLKYPSKPLNTYNIVIEDAAHLSGDDKIKSCSWSNTEHPGLGWFMASVRIPEWEMDIFDALSQNAPAFQPYQWNGDLGSGGTITIPAGELQTGYIRATVPGMEPAKEGHYKVTVTTGGDILSLDVKESDLHRVRIKMVPKLVLE